MRSESIHRDEDPRDEDAMPVRRPGMLNDVEARVCALCPRPIDPDGDEALVERPGGGHYHAACWQRDQPKPVDPWQRKTSPTREAEMLCEPPSITDEERYRRGQVPGETFNPWRKTRSKR